RVRRGDDGDVAGEGGIGVGADAGAREADERRPAVIGAGGDGHRLDGAGAGVHVSDGGGARAGAAERVGDGDVHGVDQAVGGGAVAGAAVGDGDFRHAQGRGRGGGRGEAAA